MTNIIILKYKYCVFSPDKIIIMEYFLTVLCGNTCLYLLKNYEIDMLMNIDI